MHIKEIKFTVHAVQRMFERDIFPDDIKHISKKWDVIAEYPDDSPLPSYLLLGFKDKMPVHVVAAIDEKNDIAVIITVYIPDKKIWTDNSRKRR